MAHRKTRKSRKARPGRKGTWTGKVTSFVTFLIGTVVLLLAVSTAVRWIAPSQTEPIYGRNIIRVEVLNGCGVGGVAQRVTDWLRRQGFDVVYYGDANSHGYERSILFDRSGRPEFTLEVAEAMGCHNIEKRYDRFLLLDVTVIIGKDWRSLRLAPDEPGPWESAARRARSVLESWLDR